MTSDLFGLNVTSQSLAHFDKLTKSAFIFSSSVRILGEVEIMELSSADNLVDFLNKNSREPNTEPCRTPALTGKKEEYLLF